MTFFNYLKQILAVLIVLGCSALTGCAPNNLGAPCPDFGAYCHKTPINSWNYSHDE